MKKSKLMAVIIFIIMLSSIRISTFCTYPRSKPANSIEPEANQGDMGSILVFLFERYSPTFLSSPRSYLSDWGYELTYVQHTPDIFSGNPPELHTADILYNELNNVTDYDGIYIVGCWSRTACQDFGQNDTIINLLQTANTTGMPIATLLSSVITLGESGLISGKTVTGDYPYFAEDIEGFGAEFIDAKLVVDDNIITGSPYAKKAMSDMMHYYIHPDLSPDGIGYNHSLIIGPNDSFPLESESAVDANDEGNGNSISGFFSNFTGIMVGITSVLICTIIILKNKKKLEISHVKHI